MRDPLLPGRAHLTVMYRFRSDKYEWCPDGFVPLKMSDPDAFNLLRSYGFLYDGNGAITLPSAFVLLSLEDKHARSLLKEYAPIRGQVDKEFERDLLEAIEYEESSST